jgi:hypothetical protein
VGFIKVICAHLFYKGLIPWAWIEASTKGGILLFSSSEIEKRARAAGLSRTVAGTLGGIGGINYPLK